MTRATAVKKQNKSVSVSKMDEKRSRQRLSSTPSSNTLTAKNAISSASRTTPRGTRSFRSYVKSRAESPCRLELYDASHSGSEGEAGGVSGSALIARRSRRRSMAVDHTKPIPILRPGEDIQNRLDISDKEIHEFNLLLNSDDYEPSTDTHEPFALYADTIGSTDGVVLTPGVTTALESAVPFATSKSPCNKTTKKSPTRSKNGGRRANTCALAHAPRPYDQPRSSSIPSHSCSKYLEYDADSDDESFVSTLHSNPIPPSRKNRSKRSAAASGSVANIVVPDIRCFERMVAVLERELEVAKIFLREKIRAQQQCNTTRDLVHDSRESIDKLKAFLEPTGNGAHRNKVLQRAYEHFVGDSANAQRVAYAQSSRTAVSSTDVDLSNTSRLSFPAPPVGQLVGCISDHAKTTTGSNLNPRRDIPIQGGVSKSDVKPAEGHDSGTSSTFFSEDNLRVLVPEERAVMLLAGVYQATYPAPVPYDGMNPTLSESITAPNKAHVDKNRRGVLTTPPPECPDAVRSVLSRIYSYWITKRATRLDSLLRCYHNFMMDMWHQVASMPPLPEDSKIDSLLTGHSQLHRLRYDLDRARLIVDRVRRREKIKKELIKIAAEKFDYMFTAQPGDKPTKSIKCKTHRDESHPAFDIALFLKQMRFSQLDDDSCESERGYGSDTGESGNEDSKSLSKGLSYERVSGGKELQKRNLAYPPKHSKTTDCKRPRSSTAIVDTGRRKKDSMPKNDNTHVKLGNKSTYQATPSRPVLRTRGGNTDSTDSFLREEPPFNFPDHVYDSLDNSSDASCAEEHKVHMHTLRAGDRNPKKRAFAEDAACGTEKRARTDRLSDSDVLNTNSVGKGDTEVAQPDQHRKFSRYCTSRKPRYSNSLCSLATISNLYTQITEGSMEY